MASLGMLRLLLCLHLQSRHHGGCRSIRSIARSVDRVDRFGQFGNFADFSIFSASRGARDLSGVKVSALYDAWRPKKHRKTKTNKFGFLMGLRRVWGEF